MGQPRATQRYNKRPVDDEDFLTSRIIELASKYGRYGYRRVTALLRNEGWIINHKRVERNCPIFLVLNTPFLNKRRIYCWLYPLISAANFMVMNSPGNSGTGELKENPILTSFEDF